MAFCKLRLNLNQLIDLSIKIDRANHPGCLRDEVTGEILNLQRRASELNALHKLFIQVI